MADQELEDWASLSRSITDTDRIRHAPPAAVWDQIAEAIRIDEPAPEISIDNLDPALPAPPVINLSHERETRAPVRRRQQRRLMIFAGAAAVIAFVLGLSFFTGVGEDPVVFAADVTNETLPEAFDGTASALLEIDSNPMLEISFDTAIPSDEPVELWLIKPDAESGEIVDMRSLGIVNPDVGQWTGEWPSDLDPKDYSLVDLSIEPDDGDPTHSGRSILRGQLAESELVDS